MSIWSAIRKHVDRMLDPVCQDWGACIYGKHGGKIIRLVPVADQNDPNRIASWIPDPDVLEFRNEQAQQTAKQPSLPVVTPNAAPTDAGNPGGFNPAGACGL